MLRIDRLLGEARMLRSKRAARAQAGQFDDDVWLEELTAQNRLVGDLVSEPVKDRVVEAGAAEGVDPKVSWVANEVGTIFDAGLLDGLIDSLQETIEARLVEFGAVAIVERDAYPKVCARARPSSEPILDVEAHRTGLSADAALSFKDADAIRRAAVGDAARLVVEMALFEAVRGAVRNADLVRRVTAQSEPGHVVVRNGRVMRPRKNAGDKARQNAIRNFPQVRAKYERLERERLAREAAGADGSADAAASQVDEAVTIAMEA